ncbi:hypothetical protein UNPF46_29210 [Bradyrhizobium sp. UNPF46]|nr:hypothetical protein UNPF46_29210 [Bradyrhizobium sp. UNPF46]
MRQLANALGTLFPVRLAIGVALGFLMKTLVHVAALVEKGELWIALDEFSSVWYVIVIAPLLFINVVLRSRDAPEQSAHHVSTIDLMITRSGLPRAQANQVWRSLIEKYLTSVQPDLSRPPPRLDVLFEEAKREVTDTSDPPL